MFDGQANDPSTLYAFFDAQLSYDELVRRVVEYAPWDDLSEARMGLSIAVPTDVVPVFPVNGNEITASYMVGITHPTGLYVDYPEFEFLRDLLRHFPEVEKYCCSAFGSRDDARINYEVLDLNPVRAATPNDAPSNSQLEIPISFLNSVHINNPIRYKPVTSIQLH
jgi:hypothetical protein